MRPLVIACATMAMATGVVALAGWALEIRVLRAVLPGLVPMNPVTAVGMLLAGGSLAFWTDVDDPRSAPGFSHVAVTLAVSLAVFAAALGAVRLVAIAGGPDVALDRRLFADRLAAAGGGFSNRMAPNTAAGFLAIGAALALARAKRAILASQLLALSVGSYGLLAITGYAYGLTPLYGVGPYIPMALNTAAGFFVLAIGAAFVRPDRRIAGVVSGPGVGGALARRLIPAAILLPLGLGWLRLAGQRAGLYGTEFGAAFMVVASILAFVALILASAWRIQRLDAERRRLEAADRETSLFYSSVFENLPLMVFVKDARELRFQRLNRAGEKLLGIPRDELIGRNDYDFFPPEQADSFTGRDRQVLEEGVPLDIPEEPIRTRDGETRMLHTRKVPLHGPDGEARYLLGISEDITDRKRDEEQIAHLNEELESFSYSVSHDLRAPLRSIAGFTQVIAEDHAGGLDEEGRVHLERVIAASRRMSELIDGLLLLSRVTRAELHRQDVDLSRMAREVVEDLQRAEPHRGLEVDIQEGLVVHGDPRLLQVVLQNLIGNAWKYTREEPRARIEFRSIPEAVDGPAFVVRDNGAGFDMAYADKLFGAFQRLHGADRFEGTGIGLATVQRIIHRHAGRVWAESAPGAGAAFYFTI